MEGYRWNWTVPEPRGAVVLVHGTGEHHGRYGHVAAYLNERGWDVYSGDLPGWGRSHGRRGHINSFAEYVEAVRLWTEEALQRSNSNRPVFLLGHSLGGLAATRFVQTYSRRKELSGLILTSPCLELKLAVPAWKAQLAGWLNQVWPTLSLPNGITPDMVSRDEAVQAAYRTDPLNYPKVSVRWFQELHRAMEHAWGERELLDIPVLVLQAGDDCLINADAVELFTSALEGNASFIRFAGLRHEVLNEPEREQVLHQMAVWMDEIAVSNVTY